MPDYTSVDYTPDFNLTTEQKEPAISIRPRYTPVETIPEFEDAVDQPVASTPAADANKPTILDRLFGANGAERYQLWPEKLVRSALEAPQKALRGELAPVPTEADPSGTAPEISAAQDMMNLVGVGAATPKPGGMIGMAGGKIVQPTAPTFYSAAEHAITNARQPQASADQWLGYLNNSPGVKAEELEWTGLSDLFAQRAAEGKPVTKQEILDHLVNNKVDVQAKVPTGGEDFHAYEEHMGDAFDHLLDKAPTDGVRVVFGPNGMYEVKSGDYVYSRASTAEDANRYARRLTDDIQKGHEDNLREWAEESANIQSPSVEASAGNRYAEYQLPGGENYGELVLTLPKRKYEPDMSARKKWKVGDSIPNEKPDTNYYSPHWDEPNILAHVRFNDRTINGKKTLFLEEVQSDWHQAGREMGYKGRDNLKEDYFISKEKDGKWHIKNKDGETISTEASERAAKNLVKEWQKNNEDHLLVPDAPFKKAWPELVMKQMLRKAADEGYEQIAWTPGKVQNERYPGRPKEDEAGMAKFYDEILPNVANKLGKKFGAKTYNYDVGKAPGQKGKNLYKSNNYSVHVLPITPELKQTATSKGFPLFSSGLPFMFTPVDHNPFEDQQ